MKDFILAIYIRYQGYSIIFTVGALMCCVGAGLLFDIYKSGTPSTPADPLFAIVTSVWTFIGISLMLQRKSGYYFLRAILLFNKASALFIPLLAPLSYDFDKYLQQDQVKAYFGIRS